MVLLSFAPSTYILCPDIDPIFAGLSCVLQFFGATRALVETLTRFKLIEQNRANVTLRSKSVVTGYTFNQDKSALTGKRPGRGYSLMQP
jgi:hypothetical protein